MKIALGADHAGFELKEKIRQHLLDKGILVDDRGTNSGESVEGFAIQQTLGEIYNPRLAEELPVGPMPLAVQVRDPSQARVIEVPKH